MVDREELRRRLQEALDRPLSEEELADGRRQAEEMRRRARQGPPRARIFHGLRDKPAPQE